MTDVNQLADDLKFVRDAVERRESKRRPSKLVAAYWAFYVLVGYTMIDRSPHYAGWFFLIFGILGGVFTSVVARRTSQQQGVIDRGENRVQTWQWLGSFGVAWLAAAGLSITLHLTQMAGSQVFVVLIGMIYFLGGLYGPRAVRYMVVGGPMVMAGGICVSLVPHLGWTCLGALIVVSIFGPLFAPRRETHAAV